MERGFTRVSCVYKRCVTCFLPLRCCAQSIPKPNLCCHCCCLLFKFYIYIKVIYISSPPPPPPPACSKSFSFQLRTIMISIFLFFFVLDIFTKGIWKNLGREIPDELSQYQGKLKRLCLATRAPSTVRTYGYAFQRWKKWAISYNYVFVQLILFTLLFFLRQYWNLRNLTIRLGQSCMRLTGHTKLQD